MGADEAIRTQLAAIEHTRWADWQRWVHAQCTRRPDGALIIPAELVERWERQIATPYVQLSEAEQASDMEQVDRYWPIIAERERETGLRQAVAKVEKRLRANGFGVYADPLRAALAEDPAQ